MLVLSLSQVHVVLSLTVSGDAVADAAGKVTQAGIIPVI